MRIRVGLVTEANERFLNQVKLCLYSLRKNGGALKDVDVTLISNSEPINEKEQKFLIDHFSPIEFKTMPRLGAIRHTSKLNVFYGIEPSTYDVLIYLDCDTVIAKPLDHILDPIRFDNADFLCRRGGETDRNSFTNFNALVKRLCGKNSSNKIWFNGQEEWPMFNTGVFLATSEAVQKIRKNSIEFTYQIFNEWKRDEVLEQRPIIQQLLKMKILKTRKIVLAGWPIEQGALALATIKAGIKVHYLDEIYNSWGDLEDLRILHCFKSAYGFNRVKMFSKASENWIKSYAKSSLPGKVFLASLVKEYRNKLVGL